jgi:amphi-Trp domain-containing protein
VVARARAIVARELLGSPGSGKSTLPRGDDRPVGTVTGPEIVQWHPNKEREMAEFAWGKEGTRREAAALLRRVADGVEAGEIDVEQDGIRLAVGVPAKLSFELEAELDPASGEGELEIELKWSAAKPAAKPAQKTARKSAKPARRTAKRARAVAKPAS